MSCYKILNLIFTAVGSIATAAAVIITLINIKLLYLKTIKGIIFDKALADAPPGSRRNLLIKIINKSNKYINLKDIGIKTKTYTLFYPPALCDTKNNEKFLPYLLPPEDYITLQYSQNFLELVKDLVNKNMLNRKRRITFELYDNIGKKYKIKTKKTAQQYINLLTEMS
jgi:hypothetical protein